MKELMDNKEFSQMLEQYNLDLHQQFTLTKFRQEVENSRDIPQLKELLIETMRQVMSKDNVIKYFLKKSV